MERLDDFCCEDDEADTFWAADAASKYEADLNWSVFSIGFYFRIIPFRLFSIGFISCFFITKYYVESCRQNPDGSLVAKDVYLPKSDELPIRSFLFGPIPGIFPIAVQEEPV